MLLLLLHGRGKGSVEGRGFDVFILLSDTVTSNALGMVYWSSYSQMRRVECGNEKQKKTGSPPFDWENFCSASLVR